MLTPQPLAEPVAEAVAEAVARFQTMTPLICLRDCGAPYRGRWVLYNSGTDEGTHRYCAIHHLKTPRAATPEMIEECRLSGDDETARFVRHLILHGWSIYEITDAIAASKVI